MSELVILRNAMKFFLLACGALALLSVPVQAETNTVNWYHWYQDLRVYLGSVGGVLCAPGTELQFSTEGKITAASRDATCLASLDGLNYPLPLNANLKSFTLAIRKNSAWPLSRRNITELVQHQADQAQAVAWQNQNPQVAKAR